MFNKFYFFKYKIFYKYLFIYFILLFLLNFLFQNNIIYSLPDQDYYTYTDQISKYKTNIFIYIREIIDNENQNPLVFLSYIKLFWKFLIITSINLFYDTKPDLINLDPFRLFCGSLLLMSIVINRFNNKFFVILISLFFIITFNPFKWLFTEWLRQNLALSIFFFYLKFKSSKANSNNYFNTLIGLISSLIHFSLFPSFVIIEVFFKSEFFRKYYTFLSLPILIFSLPVLSLNLGFGNELTKLIIILISIFILIFYKIKKDKINYVITSSILIPFSYFSILYKLDGITLRCFGVICPIIILFINDLYRGLKSFKNV